MLIGIDIRNIGKKRTGDEAVFFNLAKSLRTTNQCENTKNVFCLFTDIMEKNKLEEIEKNLGIEGRQDFKVIPLKTKNKFTWNFWTLPKYLRQNPVDIYLTQYITPFFIPKKIKIITIIHDVSFKVYGQFIKFSDLFFLKLLIPLSLRRADKIIGVSQFTRNEIIKYYNINPEKIEWIHNAVGDNFQKEISPEEIATTRKKYNLPEKFILYIGTMQPRKNLPTLIEAYAKLPEEMKSEIKLVLGGGKGYNYDNAINSTIKKHALEKDVILPGFILEDDKPAIFKSSYIFCNPSFYEGFGITILEAMALGVPVVASGIPPHREVAGNSAIFFDPENSCELQEDLLKVCSEKILRSKLAEKGMEQIKHFSWKKSALKILEIFKKTL